MKGAAMAEREIPRILIVDDNEQNLIATEAILADPGIEIVKADSGRAALRCILREDFALILLDVKMPEMDGIQTAAMIRLNARTKNTPLIFLTAFEKDDQQVLTAYNLGGVVDFMFKPVMPEILKTKVSVFIEIYQKTIELKLIAEQLKADIARRERMEADLRESHAKLERNLRGAIDVISEMAERKGPYAPGHHQRVAALASAIAREMGLTDFQGQGSELAAAVYDIGLMDIPIELLQDIDNLVGVKLVMYQGYPQAGHDILKKIEFPWPIADIVLQHRERYDGSGFPRGIKGADILIKARILAVADAVEDLTVHRSYRNALPMDEALAVIANRSGSLYDPDVVSACQKLIKRKT